MVAKRDVLTRISEAKTLEERTWIITDQLLSAVSERVREAALAVAVPHWFNEKVLRALLPGLGDEIGSVYERLVEFSFVEPHGRRGFRLHELTRKAVIGHLVAEKREWYKELSQRARQYFEKLPGDNERVEAVYHEFVGDEANAVRKLLDLFWDLDYRDETAAMSLLLDYIGEFTDNLSSATRLWLRYLEGRRLVVARQWEQAAGVLDSLTAEATNTPVEPWVLIELAKMAERAGNDVVARNGYERALALAQRLEDDRCIARACGCLGDSLSRQEQFKEAIEYYERALAIDRKRKDRVRECEQLRELGDVYLRRKWWETAEDYYRQSLELARSLADVTLEAWALNRLGRLEENMQHWDAAIEWYRQSQALFEGLNQHSRVAIVLHDIGDVLVQAKRYEEAEETYRQVVEVYGELGDRVAEAWTLNSLGVLEEERQQWEAAIEWYERAREVFETLKQPGRSAFVTCNIGSVLRSAKRYQEAEAAYRQAVDTFRQLRDFEEQSESLLALGHLYRKQNRAEEARTTYQQAIQVWDRNWDAHLALGWLQLSARPRETEQACQRALNGLPVHEILAHVGLATAAAVRGQVSQVQTELKTARELLGVAETKYTVVKSQLEALRIVTTVLDAPTQALQDSQAFDLEAVLAIERDLIEIAFGYLSVLAQRLMEYH